MSKPDRFNHPPLVDTKCFCRADGGGGLKTSNPCLKPNVKPSIHPIGRVEKTRNQPTLIPFLPDDLAIACLIRVNRIHHCKLRLVCKRWNRLLSSNYFYSLRKNSRLTEEWLYVMKRDHKQGKTTFHSFDPVHHMWQTLPPVPKEYNTAIGFGSAVLSGCHLYLFGGKDPVKGSMRRVVYYSVKTNKWHRAPDMLRRRQFFVSCVINNCLYVAGGKNEGATTNPPSRSAEVYDPTKNRWSFILDMDVGMVPVSSIVYRGEWILKGIVSGSYRPESNRWFSVSGGLVSGWRNPCGTLNGKIYALDCKDGCRIRVYDEKDDSWSKRIESQMHMGNSEAFEARVVIELNGKLCIVRNNMSISMVDVSKCNDMDEGIIVDEHLWETITGKGQFKTLMTNIFSSLAGRNRVKNHVLHCQVLQA
ncbi:F-box/kelch-repeat protein At1g55270-like [Impatiens glandulifera]|uniref:F-box/kelch-repeat protein At1g55270-like n=1 Tax=Impatiens glandulifera TaxID=253017 RepID=UPI001FB14966|nr:F-box/kelch-repeat protein At1g55270-like [Impatiens glandulifera]